MLKTICLFGDSIAWGAWDPERGGWGARLRNYFETNDIEIPFYNCGVAGDNTDYLLERFKVEAEAREPKIIIFAIGLNDSSYIDSKDNLFVPMKRFENNLRELISQAKEITDTIIFVGLTKVDEEKTMPTSWDETKNYDEENVKLYDLKIKEICDKGGLLFVPVFDLLEKGDLEDGLHPNSAGHQKMFLRIKKFLFSEKII